MKLTRAQIIEIATRQEFFVDRYSYRDDDKRRMCRRLAKDGKLELVSQSRDGFFYRAAARSKE